MMRTMKREQDRLREGEYGHSGVWPYHISAGGVVYYWEGEELRVILVIDEKSGKKLYNLPKGTLKYNETLEECAKREVLEESGCEAEITGFLGGETRKFNNQYDGEYVDKTVLFFAMKLLKRRAEHDLEYDLVESFSPEEAISLMLKTRPEKEEYKMVARLLEFLDKDLEKVR